MPEEASFMLKKVTLSVQVANLLTGWGWPGKTPEA